MGYQVYQRQRIAASLCITCGTKLDDYYMSCRPCRNKQNDRRSQRTFDQRLERESLLNHRYHLISTKAAAEILRVSMPRIYKLIYRKKKITVCHHERGRVWVSRDEVEALASNHSDNPNG